MKGFKRIEMELIIVYNSLFSIIFNKQKDTKSYISFILQRVQQSPCYHQSCEAKNSVILDLLLLSNYSQFNS